MCDNCTPREGSGWTSEPNTRERFAEIREKQVEDIMRVGHQVVFVYPDAGDDGAGFFYTAGRCVFEKPELLLTGSLEPQAGQEILNAIAQLEDQGKIDIDNLATGNPCQIEGFDSELRFIACDPERAEMNAALELAGEGPMEAYQVIWPDEYGKWPEDPGFYYGPSAQPLYPR